MDYVSDVALREAQEMEDLFAALPPDAGILFVSVTAEPAPDGKVQAFTVRLGMKRVFSESTGKALISKLLAPQMSAGKRILAAVYRGVSGACRDDGSSSARPPAAS